MAVRFEDYTIQVEQDLSDAGIAFLYEASELLKGQAAQASPVASGQLKGSWDYEVDTGAKVAQIGSPLENAIWNEFGTGEYAVAGNGRKGGWKYKDSSGKWHFTFGKRPRRTLQATFSANKGSIIRRAEQIFKERMN